MLNISLEEAFLLIRGGITLRVACPGTMLIVVVVRPLRKVVGEFLAGHIGSSVLEVDYDELLVFVSRLQEW